MTGRGISAGLLWVLMAIFLTGALASLLIAGGWMRVGSIERAASRTGVTIRLSDLGLNVVDIRPEGGEIGAVLLIHGAATNSSDLLEPLRLRLLARHLRVIAIDRPGLGWSDRTLAGRSIGIDQQRDIFREVLKIVGVNHAVIVSHSIGACVALDLSQRYPDIVDGVLLLAPVIRGSAANLPWPYLPMRSGPTGWIFAHLILPSLGPFFLESEVTSAFRPQELPPHYLERTNASLMLRPDRFEANAEDVFQLASIGAVETSELAGLKVPATILSGNQDRAVPGSELLALSALAPNVRVITVPGVGHQIHWARPDLVTDEILRLAPPERRAPTQLGDLDR